MRQPPSLSQLRRYPISGGICVLAITVTIAASLKIDITPLYMSYLAFWREPWRLISCVFPHANAIHIVGNLYWIWVLGTLIEENFGSLRAGALMLVLALGSSAAEYAFDVGGIGLSGVAYGLFGFLWVASRFVPDLRDAVDLRTVQLFIVWFFFCILLTGSQLLRIGNVAHGSGLVLGAIAGCLVAPRQGLRFAGVSGVVIGLAATLCAATIWRPLVNFDPQAHLELERAGTDAIAKGDNHRAVVLLQAATRYRGAEARTWYNLGNAFQRLNERPQAETAYAMAVKMDPAGTSNHGSALNYLAWCAAKRGEHEKAIELYRRAINAGVNNALIWKSVGSELRWAGRNEEASDAYKHAQSLAPSADSTAAPATQPSTNP